MTMKGVQAILKKSWSVLIKDDQGQSVGLVSVDVGPMVDTYPGVWIARVKTPPRFQRQGRAHRAMIALMKACRRHRVDAYLVPGAYGEMSQKQLRSWYVRLGFKPVPGAPGLYRFGCSPKHRDPDWRAPVEAHLGE